MLKLRHQHSVNLKQKRPHFPNLEKWGLLVYVMHIIDSSNRHKALQR
ncbi:hypothetical protein SAMN02983011_02028 [Lactobacillus kefiranofaciens]|uniref:Transposase n=1 Tax=Lactobacillus kefiranofaciens TaxID=267818 RepID=A0ABY0MDX8_9LACO|nr:hypothetical protein WANG_0322 [Lactobacillus kefiranofaciens subsp. kefiranofaciens]SDA66726.1 hypothetical protein SAMN02983011_02028 [Lactobacillus kefiranofaciens]